MAKTWVSDTVPSLPAPSTRKHEVDLGGFVFTGGGIAHSISSAMLEDMHLMVNAPTEINDTSVWYQGGAQ